LKLKGTNSKREGGPRSYGKNREKKFVSRTLRAVRKRKGNFREIKIGKHRPIRGEQPCQNNVAAKKLEERINCRRRTGEEKGQGARKEKELEIKYIKKGPHEFVVTSRRTREGKNCPLGLMEQEKKDLSTLEEERKVPASFKQGRPSGKGRGIREKKKGSATSRFSEEQV